MEQPWDGFQETETFHLCKTHLVFLQENSLQQKGADLDFALVEKWEDAPS